MKSEIKRTWMFLMSGHGLGRRPRRGFTLIELLLGLTIFALLSVSIAATLWAGIKLSDRMDPQRNIVRQAQWSLNLMADELENAQEYDFSRSYPDKAAFWGEPSRVTFLLETHEGLKMVRYGLIQPEASRIHTVQIGNVYAKNVAVSHEDHQADAMEYLIREEIPLKSYFADEGQTWSMEVLNTHVRAGGLTFLYEYDDQGQGPAQFLQTSAGQQDLPYRVRLQMDILIEGAGRPEAAFQRDVLIPTRVFGRGQRLENGLRK